MPVPSAVAARISACDAGRRDRNGWDAQFRDFIPALRPLLDETRRLGLVGFKEQVNSLYGELVPSGLKTIDLEYYVAAFNVTLPRIRIIPLDEFDPLPFLMAKPG